MITCKCYVCSRTWKYQDNIDKDIIRASVAPCGHQGLFEILKDTKKPAGDVEKK